MKNILSGKILSGKIALGTAIVAGTAVLRGLAAETAAPHTMDAVGAGMEARRVRAHVV